MCSDGDIEICVINFDGTRFKQLTYNNSFDGEPWINGADQIAYRCDDGDSEICTINAARTGFRNLDNDNSVPSIN